jgi:sugar lactone lactonase YvrE
MTDARTTRRIARVIVSVAIVFVFATVLGACGDGTSTGGDAGDTTERDGSMEAAGTERYVLPGEQVFPEGVTYRSDTGDFYVGSTTDGTVFRGNVEGDSKRTEVFLEPGTDGRKTASGLEVDAEGRLFIAGGDTGEIFVYDTESGDLVRRLSTPEAEATFLNDVAVTPEGDAYFTDSMRPVLFRVPATGEGVSEPEPWLNFEGTPLEYEEGFNLNGIDATEDGRYLIVVQSNTGELFRIDTESKGVVEIDLGGETLTNGDGLLLDGGTVYVLRNQQELIVPVELSGDYTSGEAGEGFTDPSFATIAKHGGRLVVVNSQFDRQGGEPELPFTVSDVAIP